MWRTYPTVSAILGLLLLPRCSSAQGPGGAVVTRDVERAVRAYAAGYDASDGAAMARFLDSTGVATLAEDGLLLRGWSAIRAHFDSVAENARLYGDMRLQVTAIDVTSLGPDYAVAVVICRRIMKPSEWPCVITAVLRRTSRGWRAVTMHQSTVPTVE